MANQKEKVFIIFDGSNFYHILKNNKVDIQNTLQYQYSFGLMKKVSETRLLNKKDLEKFA